MTSASKQTAATQNTALRIELDNGTRLWYNMPMQTETPVTPSRIIPRSSQTQYAYAFGYLRGKVQSLIDHAGSPHYFDSETRLLELESKILDIESILKQLESEMYPNA